MAAASSVVPPMDDDQLQAVYTWLDSVPLSRPKRNCTRDFSDGGERRSTNQCALDSFGYVDIGAGKYGDVLFVLTVRLSWTGCHFWVAVLS